jgi:lactate permease
VLAAGLLLRGVRPPVAALVALAGGVGLLAAFPTAPGALADAGLLALGTLTVLACTLWLAILGANLVIGTAMAGILGSVAAIGALLALARRAEGRLPTAGVGVRRAAGPYALLLVLLLAGQGAAVLATRAGADAAAVVLGSAATWLLLTCLLLSWRARHRAGPGPGPPPEPRPSPFRAVLPRWAPFAVTTAAFLTLGALMTASGMAAGLAAAGAALGRAYQGVAPWLGGLGGFLTGSNAGGNALFAAAQAEAARRIGVPVLELVAFQNLAASLGTMGSAARVQLALGLLEPEERDPAIARQVLATCVAAMVALSLLALVTSPSG